MNTIHEPVLLKEIVRELHIKNQGKYIDATLGAGGYTKAILSAGGTVLGIDADESMIQIAKENLKDTNAKIAHGNFENIKKIAEENGFMNADGIVFDLGVSNFHFMDDTRGFSFRNPEADLDMRLDVNSQGLKASDLLNALREDQLKEMFGNNISRRITEYRKIKKFEKVSDFLSLFPSKKPGERIHPATKAFLALRIAVNSELDNLKEALPEAMEILKRGGRLVVVSFNSDEDRIVKEIFNSHDFVKPTSEEIERNAKSRSAILRVFEK
ncbi:16S rRNA (cytosine(1402)-N(4))-methyltransferase RsmH [soil metagenome]